APPARGREPGGHRRRAALTPARARLRSGERRPGRRGGAGGGAGAGAARCGAEGAGEHRTGGAGGAPIGSARAPGGAPHPADGAAIAPPLALRRPSEPRLLPARARAPRLGLGGAGLEPARHGRHPAPPRAPRRLRPGAPPLRRPPGLLPRRPGPHPAPFPGLLSPASLPLWTRAALRPLHEALLRNIDFICLPYGVNALDAVG